LNPPKSYTSEQMARLKESPVIHEGLAPLDAYVTGTVFSSDSPFIPVLRLSDFEQYLIKIQYTDSVKNIGDLYPVLRTFKYEITDWLPTHEFSLLSERMNLVAFKLVKRWMLSNP
jgi:hypothetical protein